MRTCAEQVCARQAPVQLASRLTVERRVLIVVGLGTLMASVDTSVTNIALRTIGRVLQTPVVNVQWVVAGYLLAVASVIPVSGWAARRLSARRLYIAGLVVFAAASGACAMADSLWLLVACRIAQGAAAGLLIPLSQLIGVEVAGPDRVARAMSRIWMITDFGLVLGPVLGGILISSAGWRWIFLINVPIGLAAAVLGFFLLPSLSFPEAGKLDLQGALRLSPGLVLSVLALAEAERSGSPFSLVPVGALALGIILIADFVRRAGRQDNPLLDVRLFRRRAFALSSLVVVGFDVAWFGTALLIPLYLQQVRGLSPLLTGLLLVPQGVGVVVGLWRGGCIADQIRARRLGVAAMSVSLLALAVFTQITPGTSYWVIGPVLLTTGFAFGFAWIPTIAASYENMSSEDVTHASPIFTVLMRFSASLGTAFAAIMLQSALTDQSAPMRLERLTLAYHSAFSWTIVCGVVAVPALGALARRQR